MTKIGKAVDCGKKIFPRSKRAALTLIELLLVLLIIAVLTLILFPIASQLTTYQKRVVCLNNVRTVLQASLNYSNEDNGGFPILATTIDENGKEVREGLTLSSLLHKNGYLKDKTIFCPLISKEIRKDPVKLYGFRYAINIGLIWEYPKIRQVPAPHSKVALISEFYVDSSWYSAGHLDTTMNRGIDLGHDTIRNAQYHGTKTKRGLHMGFLDGHCELIRPENNDWSSPKTAVGEKNPRGYFYTHGAFKGLKNGDFTPQ